MNKTTPAKNRENFRVRRIEGAEVKEIRFIVVCLGRLLAFG